MKCERETETKTIRELCELVVDCPHSTPTWTSQGKIVVRNNNIKNGRIDLSSPSYTDEEHYKQRTKRAVPRPGDIIITREAPIGEVGMIPDGVECCLGQRMVLLRPNLDICNNYYLLYSLQSRFVQHQISWSEGTGTTVSNLRIPHLEQIKIPYLPLEEQEKISSFLRVLDEKINLNRGINANLQQQAQAIFKSWFVDFEPFGGTMPSDWKTVSLDTIVDFQNGYAFKSKELLEKPAPNTYRVFKQGHIKRGGGFNTDGTKSWYPKETAQCLNKYVLRKGDILMAMTDMKNNVAILGNTAIMPVDNEYILNQRVGLLRTKGTHGITYPFIYILTNTQDFLTDLRSRANSGVQVNLSSTEIKASKTVLAPKEINEHFSSIVMPMMETMLQNQLENERISQLRDTLLPRLMSGEISVLEIGL